MINFMAYHIDLDIEFRKNPGPGVYIVLEGIDGSGKTTQVERLAEELRSKGKEVIITAEPNETIETGKLIREVLSGKTKIPSATIQYLMTANRIINHDHIVEPALKKGAYVLSSRSFWSAIPYGEMDKILDSTSGEYRLNEMNQILVAHGILTMFHQFMVADYTFYLDISVDTAMDRLSGMDKHNEVYEKRDRLEKIRKGYHFLAEKFPEHITTISGERDMEEITKELLERILA